MSTTVCWIKWQDASYERGEARPDEVEPGVYLQTCGQLVREDDEFVSLALDHFEGSATYDATYRHICHIPKVNIIRERRFEVRRT